MNFFAGCVTDIGIRRKNNQDSICYELAEYNGKPIAFYTICDGMGGLAKGEMASATVLRAFDEWFLTRMPQLVKDGFTAETLQNEWGLLADKENQRISNYASTHGIKMGTTLTTALFIDGQCYVLHVGDCRLYEISPNGVHQLTHDHTVTQRNVDQGLISQEDAETDPRQHILLQCIGAGYSIAPEFYAYPICNDGTYLICSDGFRHKFSTEEMKTQFIGEKNMSKQAITMNLRAAIEKVKNRGETDNITAGLLTVK